MSRGSRRREAVGFNWDAKRSVARCNVYLKGGGGKTRKRITSHAASRDEALEKWIAFRKKWRHVSADRTKTPTLREFVDAYFEEITAGLKPATVRDYLYTLRGRILPEFGSTKLNEITSGHVNLFVKRLQQAHLKRDSKRALSPATVNATVDVLKLVINKAVRWDVLDETPFRKPIEHVKVVPPTLELSEEERESFLSAFDDENVRVCDLHAGAAMQYREVRPRQEGAPQRPLSRMRLRRVQAESVKGGNARKGGQRDHAQVPFP